MNKSGVAPSGGKWVIRDSYGSVITIYNTEAEAREAYGDKQ